MAPWITQLNEFHLNFLPKMLYPVDAILPHRAMTDTPSVKSSALPNLAVL